MKARLADLGVSGEATNIATETVVRAPADGYTLLLVGPTQAINATLYNKLNFDFIRDITPVAGIVVGPNVMVVNPSVSGYNGFGVHRLRQGECGQDQHGELAQ